MAQPSHPTMNKNLTSNLPSHVALSPLSASSSQTIIAIVFGLSALAIGIITVYQSHKAWKIWHATRPDGIAMRGTIYNNLHCWRSLTEPELRP